MKPRTQLIFLRHGETRFNVEGRLQGQQDSPLTELGVHQARALAERIAAFKVDVLMSSDLGRALKTAAFVSQACGLPVVEDSRFRERAYGELEGLTWTEAREHFPDGRDLYRTNPDVLIPGGESMRQLYERASDAVEVVGKEQEGKRVAIVSHGGFISSLFRYVVGMPLDVPRRARLPNAAINIIEKVDDGWIIRTWGDTAHLGNELDSI